MAAASTSLPPTSSDEWRNGSGKSDLSASAGHRAIRPVRRPAVWRLQLYGIVTASQVAYTRSGPTLALNPPLTHAFDKSTIPYYNVYFSDTWHMKPSFHAHLRHGLDAGDASDRSVGQADVLVDASDTPVKTLDYLAQRKAAALEGPGLQPGTRLCAGRQRRQQATSTPTIRSMGRSAPASARPGIRILTATDFGSHVFGHEGTVIRGGYGRIYGR